MNLQAPWVNEVTKGIEPKDLETFRQVLLLLRDGLESGLAVV